MQRVVFGKYISATRSSHLTERLLGLVPKPGSRIVLAGGAGGIGRACVSACQELDLVPVVMDLALSIENASELDTVERIAFDARNDISIQAAIESVAKHSSEIDGFVFLSGFPILPRRSLDQVSTDQWDELMAVNLRSAYLLATGLLPLLLRSEKPAIVMVASSLAYQVMPGMAAYATSKGGLVSLTKAIAMENAPRLRANVVAPGAVETSFLSGGISREEVSNDRTWFNRISENYVASIPLQRVAVPADIVGPIMFLLGDASSYMTGQVLHLNGGRLTP